MVNWKKICGCINTVTQQLCTTTVNEIDTMKQNTPLTFAIIPNRHFFDAKDLRPGLMYLYQWSTLHGVCTQSAFKCLISCKYELQLSGRNLVFNQCMLHHAIYDIWYIHWCILTTFCWLGDYIFSIVIHFVGCDCDCWIRVCSLACNWLHWQATRWVIYIILMEIAKPLGFSPPQSSS